MTYPPQPGQPGQPDPYGQQPQSGGFPQQPYPQQGGWDPNQQQQQQPYPTQQYPQGWDPNAQQQQQQYQQPGYPPNPQQGWGDPNQQQQQQQGWGDPNAQQQAWADPNAQQYGQQQWDPNAAGGYSQGFGGPPAPPKQSKTGMWIAIGAAVVVVLAVLGITGFVAPGFFLSKEDTAAPPATSTSARPSTTPRTTSPRTTTPTTRSSAPGGTTGAAKGETALRGFIDKLNAGDTPGALALGCADSRDLLDSWLKTFLKSPLQLQLGNVPDDKFLVEGDVTGTSAGKAVKGTLSATNFDDKGFCVSTMLVS